MRVAMQLTLRQDPRLHSTVAKAAAAGCLSN